MIVFDLACAAGHRFEGWFGSTADYTAQSERGLVTCPHCGTEDIKKAPMAPAVGVKGNTGRVADGGKQVEVSKLVSPVANGELPPEVTKVMQKLAEVQKKALMDSTWVGKDFAEKSRAIHYGEKPGENIHGEATLQEAKDLHDEGIAVSALPFPVSPPDEVN